MLYGNWSLLLITFLIIRIQCIESLKCLFVILLPFVSWEQISNLTYKLLCVIWKCTLLLNNTHAIKKKMITLF